MKSPWDIILPALGTAAAAVVFKLIGVFYFGGLAAWGFPGEFLAFAALAAGVLLAYIPIPNNRLRWTIVVLALVIFVPSLMLFNHIRNTESTTGQEIRDAWVGAGAFTLCYLSFGYLTALLVRSVPPAKSPASPATPP